MNRLSTYLTSIVSRSARAHFYDKTMIERVKVSTCEVTGRTSKINVELPLHEEWLNNMGSLHGGAISTIIDQITTMAIAAVDDRNSVSIDLSVSFTTALKEGETMQIEAICHKIGKSLAFTSAEIKSKGVLIASGKHTKFMLNSTWIEPKV